MATIYIITSSIRKERIGDRVADFATDQLQSVLGGHQLERVDLKDWPLPYVDGQMPSATSDNYQTDGANDWAEYISKANAFVFLTPEYNASIPAQLKTNLDAIYDEWLDKKAVVISYSGSKAGGASAAQHLKDILERLKLEVVAPVSLNSWGTEYAQEQQYAADITAAGAKLDDLLR